MTQMIRFTWSDMARCAITDTRKNRVRDILRNKIRRETQGLVEVWKYINEHENFLWESNICVPGGGRVVACGRYENTFEVGWSLVEKNGEISCRIDIRPQLGSSSSI